jgi:hypothetical protein
MALRKYLRARDIIGGFLKVTFHSHIRERSGYILCKPSLSSWMKSQIDFSGNHSQTLSV